MSRSTSNGNLFFSRRKRQYSVQVRLERAYRDLWVDGRWPSTDTRRPDQACITQCEDGRHDPKPN